MHPQTEYSEETEARSLPRKPRVLVVEDTYNTRALLSYNLKKEGYDVRAIDNADSVLSLINSWKPVVILLDIMMPGSRKCSVDLCLEIKDTKDSQHITVIIVSGITQACSTSSEQIRLSLKADGYFTKPFDIGRLLKRIQEAVTDLEPQFSDSPPNSN